jgi:hypothetical protein
MSETKFTPGPWAIDGFHTSAVIAKLPDKTYVRVADCDTPSFPNPDWKANSHLIAASPELYKMLVHATRFLDETYNDMARCGGFRPYNTDLLYAALRKARGESQ